jgi:magnesium chelatase family protein
MNPTPTGGFGDAQRGRVTAQEARRYLNKISGPLLDRIDIHVEVPAVGHELLSKGEPGEPSAAIRSRIVAARQRQHERFAKAKSRRTRCNAQMTPKELRAHAPLAAECQDLLRIAMSELGLSARAHDRILRVARTIADLAEREAIGAEDISEAIQYRTLDRQLWG